MLFHGNAHTLSIELKSFFLYNNVLNCNNNNTLHLYSDFPGGQSALQASKYNVKYYTITDMSSMFF